MKTKALRRAVAVYLVAICSSAMALDVKSGLNTAAATQEAPQFSQYFEKAQNDGGPSNLLKEMKWLENDGYNHARMARVVSAPVSLVMRKVVRNVHDLDVVSQFMDSAVKRIQGTKLISNKISLIRQGNYIYVYVRGSDKPQITENRFDFYRVNEIVAQDGTQVVAIPIRPGIGIILSSVISRI